MLIYFLCANNIDFSESGRLTVCAEMCTRGTKRHKRDTRRDENGLKTGLEGHHSQRERIRRV